MRKTLAVRAAAVATLLLAATLAGCGAGTDTPKAATPSSTAWGGVDLNENYTLPRAEVTGCLRMLVAEPRKGDRGSEEGSRW